MTTTECLDEREQLEELRSLIDSSPDIVARFDSDGRCLYVNKAMEKLAGLRQSALLGKTISETGLPQEVIAPVEKVFEESRATKRGTAFEVRYGGKIFQSFLLPELDAQGDAVAFKLFSRDATDILRAEEELRQSEERFRLIYEKGPIGMAIEDRDLRFIKANAALCSMLGYTENELRGRAFTDFTHPEHSAADRRHAAMLLRGELKKYHTEKRYIKKNGEILWASTTVSPIQDASGKLLYFLAIVEDITRRKRIEEELRTTTEEQDRFFNTALDLLCIADTGGHFRRLNAAWTKTLGYDLDELLSKSFYEFIHPDDIPATREAVAALASQKKVVNFINRYRHKDGTYRWLEWRSAPYGSLIYAATRDITARKQAEDALREREERLRFALEGARDGLWDVDLKFNTFYLSPRGCEILGFTPDEIHRTAKTWIEQVHPDDLAPTLKVLADYAEGRTKIFEVEQRLRTKSGEWKWVLSRGKAVARDSDNKPVRMVGTHTDITERKQKEKELRESEERYRALFENMLNGFAFHKIVVDEKNRPVDYIFLEVNEEFLRQTGLEKDAVVGRRITEVNPAITEDEFNWIREYGKVALEGKKRNFEQYSKAFGRWYAVQAYAPFPGYFATIVEDITGRKRAEEALQASETKYRQLHESMRDAFVRVDMNGCIIEFNESYRKMLGYTPEELFALKYTDLTPEKWQAAESRIVQEQVLRKGFSDIYEKEYRRKGGTIFPVELRSFLLSDVAGQANSMWAIVRDISDRKANERILKESYARVLKSFDDTVTAITRIVETRDPYTAGHQRHVSQLGFAMARELGLPEKQAEGIRIAGLLHDVGKIYVPTEILSKPGRLSKIEFDIIKIHPQAGYDILHAIEFPWPVAEVAYQHQERLDGTGYPLGLKADDILLETKIISVADTVEAMTFSRPYRPVIGLDKALAQIEKGKDILYDSRAVDVCLELFQRQKFTFVL